MHANLRRYRIDPDFVDEMKRRVEEGFVPLVSEMPGFLGHYIVDAGGGEVLAISIFEEESGADRSQVGAAEWVEKNLPEMLPSDPEIIEGEVLVHVHKLR